MTTSADPAGEQADSDMRSLMLILMAVTGLLAAGCTRMPQPTGYPFTEQRKMQAAHHWDVLASDVADQINRTLVRRGYTDRAVYVRPSCGEPEKCGSGGTFAFDEGFQDLLTTRLVNDGVPTRPHQTDDALVVDYKVQVVYHHDPPLQWPRPGVLTTLATGIVVLRDAPLEVVTLAASGAVDFLRATATVNGHFEVIVTTSIVDNDLYLMRKSDIYYINDADFWQYQPMKPAPELELTSSSF